VLSESGECHIVELTHSEAQVSAFIAAAARCGQIVEVVRSGALGMTRTLRALAAAASETA
jgi:acetolactate synthase small subunit